MENATDALYMGFAMIVFVVALSLSIFSFSEVTSASQRIIDARDKTTMYNYYTSTGTSRIVTREDIIPTLYRAYYENYLVEFKDVPELKGGLYQVKNKETNDFENTYIIDLENQTIGNHEDADALITHLLQGNLGELINKNTRFNSFKDLSNESFYDILSGKTFKEEIGLFYMEDRRETLNEEVDDVNKTRKRIITYTYKPLEQSDENG